MTLKILSIEKYLPNPPRKRPLKITVELPDLTQQEFWVHESKLDEISDKIMDQFPEEVKPGTVLAVLWGLWKHRKQGASLASLLNVDIEQ